MTDERDKLRMRTRAAREYVNRVPMNADHREDQVLFRRRLERAARMIERMPPKCRKVFLMQVIDGASYADISAHMGISVATVKMHLVRAFEICAAHAEAEGIAKAIAPSLRQGASHE